MTCLFCRPDEPQGHDVQPVRLTIPVPPWTDLPAAPTETVATIPVCAPHRAGLLAFYR